MIPVVPVAKGRPRFSRRGFTYTPQKTRDAEAEIRRHMTKKWPREPLECAVAFDVHFFMPVPASWSKKKRERTYGAWHTSRPDLDNLYKLATDSLIGIVIKDDAQIAEATLRKSYSGKPRIEVIIKTF